MESLQISGSQKVSNESYLACLSLWCAAIEQYYDEAKHGDTEARRDLLRDGKCLGHMCSFTGHDFDTLLSTMRTEVRRIISLNDMAISGGLLIRRSHHKGESKRALSGAMTAILGDADKLLGKLDKDSAYMARKFNPLRKRINEMDEMQ